MDIIIDFDGTCVTHEFPEIGKDIGSDIVLKKLISHGHNLILFTMRCDLDHSVYKNGIEIPPGKYLTEAVEWFRNKRIKLYGIQKNPLQHEWTTSTKAYGNIIIDDSSLGCPVIFDENLSDRPFVDWESVHDILQYRGFFKKPIR